MIYAIALAVVAFLIVAVMLSRQTSRNKKVAIADLEAERETVGTYDIFELVESEIRALGLLDIDGATDVPHAVLLKVWKENQDVVEGCAGTEHLAYVVADGVQPADANDDDVTLGCREPRIENENE